MILYKTDWEKYPYAIPDYETKNASFLRLAGLFKHMGIENNSFMLALHDTSLQGVDPHSEDLSTELMHKIAVESNVNPWYFFREVMRLPPPAGPNPIMLRANRANISAIWLFLNHITYLLIQPRQTGKSAVVQSIFVWLLQIATINNTIATLTKDDQVRKDGVAKMKGIMEYLPKYLDLRTSKDSKNQEDITIMNLGNRLQTLVPSTSEARARNVGRGLTITTVNIDEFAFVKYISETLTGLMPTLTAARDVAKDIDSPYGTIFTSTPGYLSDRDGRFAYEFYNGCYRWNEALFDVTNRPHLQDVIIKNAPSKRPYVLLEYNHRQLGYTDEWLREQITSQVLPPEKIDAEFLLIWSDSTSTSPLSKEAILTLKENIRYDHTTKISDYGYTTRWYITDEELQDILNTRHIIIGLDTSDAVGSDEIGLVMRDSYNAEVIAVGNFNETNLIIFSQWICDLLIEYENSILVIERKSSGVVIIDNLILLLLAKGHDPFKRIFNWVVNDYNVNPKYKEILDTPFYKRDKNVYEVYRSKFGFATTATGRQGRDKIYGAVFNTSTRYTSHSVKDKQLTLQLLGLEVRNGRIDHKNGGRDDIVVSWLLAFWFLSYAENKRFYGIDPQLVMVNVNNTIIEEQGGIEGIRKRERQEYVKKEIVRILEDYNSARSEVTKYMLSNKMKKLYSELDGSDINIHTLNIEQLIENIKTFTNIS
ncbi:MAG: hypothetical protein K2M73_07985 [Lachnospiraceae bacterium]|nr:hypothetical protein [Lachnospiraceae bacterium]